VILDGVYALQESYCLEPDLLLSSPAGKGSTVPLACRDKSEYLTMERISGMHFTISKDCDSNFADLVARLLQKEPSKRIGFRDLKEIREHTAFSGACLTSLRECCCFVYSSGYKQSTEFATW
jgi:hypothetical protein